MNTIHFHQKTGVFRHWAFSGLMPYFPGTSPADETLSHEDALHCGETHGIPLTSELRMENFCTSATLHPECTDTRHDGCGQVCGLLLCVGMALTQASAGALAHHRLTVEGCTLRCLATALTLIPRSRMSCTARARSFGRYGFMVYGICSSLPQRCCKGTEPLQGD